MQRVDTLLEKIKELNRKSSPSLIEVDLMLDYTRVLYADIMEWRNKMAFTENFTIRNEKELEGIASSLEENHEVIERPEVSPPSVELGISAGSYETKGNSPQVIPGIPEIIAANDIRKLIGINDKYQYISELFGNDKEAYEEIISEINTFDSAEEAIEWLHKTRVQWEEDSEAVQSFYDVVNNFFRKS
jgi:hypothetical protein